MKKFIVFMLFLWPILVASQIQINEIFADNGDCCLDDSLETEDFLELINVGDFPIDIAGYYFGDQDGGSVIPSGYPETTTISSGQVLLLWFDNDPEQGPLHIDAKLNNNGETILAIDLAGDTIIDVSYGPQSEDVSFAALPDGEPYDTNWSLTMCPTPGEFNTPCPLVQGCTSINATNYSLSATIEDGSCVFGFVEGVVINEYSAANCDNDGGSCGNYDDWIEIYNNSANPIDLNGYYVSDRLSDITKWQFTSPLVLDPGEHAIIYASGLDPDFQVSNNTTSFKLTQTKSTEYVVISSPEGVVLDYKKITKHQLNHSVGRATDGASDWSVFTNQNPGEPNQNETAYLEYAPTPSFNLDAGPYSDDIDLAIECDAYEVEIYYTLDGSAPTNNSILYASIDAMGNTIYANDEWISISETTVIRAIAYTSNPALLTSFIETNTYFINDFHTTMVISVSGEDVDNLLNGNGWMRPVGSFEVFDQAGILIDEAVGEFNEHGNDSWAYGQRGFDYITRDQYGYNYAIRDELFTTKDRGSFQRLILKAAANDNYTDAPGSPAHIRDSYLHSLSQIGDLRMDERSHESCVLYVNGEYWGVYDVREKVDDLDFLDYYYDQPDGYVDFLKTWGNTWVEFGDNTTVNEWDDLVDFITQNDMSDQANYDYVKSVYNTGSLIDYFILNSYAVCMDWLNWNTGWWRGNHPDGDKKKWRYILWDLDASFGHYINYTGIPDTGPEADPCDPEGLGDPGGQGHVPILNALFDNEDFTADYINRYADLSNTIFSCDFMIGHLDSLIGVIAPEMPRQVERWGGTVSGWEDNVQELRDFILDRCSDEFVEGMEDCYDVQAMDVTVIIEGGGEVEINSIDLAPQDSPWTGIYYSGLPIQLSANGFGNGAFTFYWEVLEGDLVLEDPTNPDIIFDLSSPLVIVANFDACVSVPTDQIIGELVVEEGSIWQYTFPSEFTNNSEWSVDGGEILFTSSTENTIAVQWNFGTGLGQIVLSQYVNEEILECLFVDVEIIEAQNSVRFDCVGGDCLQAMGGEYSTLEDCLTLCEDNTWLADIQSGGVVIFPNPAQDNLSVVFRDIYVDSFELFDTRGAQIYTCHDCGGYYAQEVTQIPISNLSPGLYLLFVRTPAGPVIQTFSKK
tara:strand:+ start:1570 stop:4980 length:3411 start_codon:yes stop_codon:yes gene_type:complete